MNAVTKVWKSFCVLGFLLISVLYPRVEAGQITLVFKSFAWDVMPVVKICEGNNAPQQCSHGQTLHDVQHGIVYVGESKVCYKRSANPDGHDRYERLTSIWDCCGNPGTIPNLIHPLI